MHLRLLSAVSTLALAACASDPGPAPAPELPDAGGDQWVAEPFPTAPPDAPVGGDTGGTLLQLHALGGTVTSTAWLPDGDLVIAGSFATSMELGGVVHRTANAREGFVARLDHAGGVDWFHELDAGAWQEVLHVAIDPTGDVAFAATVIDEVSGAGDVLVGVLRGGDGQERWTDRFGDRDQDLASGLAVDSAGAVVITGVFQGTIHPGGKTMVAATPHSFVVKYDGATGVAAWAVGIGLLAEPGPRTTAIAIGPRDLVVTAGVAFDSGGFVFEIFHNGDFFNLTLFPDTVVPEALAVDGAGNVDLAATFTGTVDLGAAHLVGAGTLDLLVTQLDANLEPRWTRAFGNRQVDQPAALVLDPAGRLVLAASFREHESYGGDDLVAAGSTDAAVIVLDPGDGHHLASFGAGGTSFDAPRALAIAGGQLALGGLFVSDFSFGDDTVTAPSSAGDGFLLRTPLP